jgi:hypothetical protein
LAFFAGGWLEVDSKKDMVVASKQKAQGKEEEQKIRKVVVVATVCQGERGKRSPFYRYARHGMGRSKSSSLLCTGSSLVTSDCRPTVAFTSKRINHDVSCLLPPFLFSSVLFRRLVRRLTRSIIVV